MAAPNCAFLTKPAPQDAGLLAARTVAIAERRRPVHRRGGTIVQCDLLIAIGRQHGDDDSDEDAYLQYEHVGVSNLIPISLPPE